MKILVTGGAADWRQKDENGRYIPKQDLVGIVDKHTLQLAEEAGIRLTGGCINKRDGRVRVDTKYVFPGAHQNGMALRSRVVWWLNTGEVIIGNTIDIHHINEIRHDDSFTNLEKRGHSEHSKHHNSSRIKRTVCICKACGSEFEIATWRLKDPSRGQYCSSVCYQNKPRDESHKMAISQGLKAAYAEGRR